jgi:hypothetical protein
MPLILGIPLLIVVIIVFLAVAFFVVKSIVHLVINTILGLVILFIVNFFHLMQYAGKPDIGYDIITILICAIGGITGAIIVIVLALLGITV